MPYTLQNAKDDLGGIIHGKNVSKITNISSAARRAGRNLIAKIDIDEIRVITTINLYDKVVDTAIPSDLNEKAIIDIRPQFTSSRQRSASDNLGNRMSKDFDFRRSWGSWFSIVNNAGTKYARVKAELTPAASTLDDLTELGGWIVFPGPGNDASNLAVENIIYPQGALQFDIINGGNSIGVITNSDISPVDLTDYVDKSAVFFELYIPTAAALAALSSIDFLWGSDDNNYYYRTGVTPHFGSLKVGKNLMRANWNGATVSGTPDDSAIAFAEFDINTTGAEIDGLIISNIFFSIASIWDIEYYSNLLFSDSNGVWKNTLDDDTDLINLEEATYNLWLYEFAIAGLQQIQGAAAKADREYFQGELYGTPRQEGLYDIYKKNNPSQKEKVTSTYYPMRGFRGADGERFTRG